MEYAFLLLLILCPTLASVLTLHTSYKYYASVYKKLPSMKMDRLYGLVYCESEGFIWFTETNSIKLCEGVYLHNLFFTYFDPYSFYWLMKYKKWLNKNIDANKP